MTREQARNLKIGDRVVFVDGCLGKVVDKSYIGVQITWDDGKAAIFQFDAPKCPWGSVFLVEVTTK